MKLFEMLEGRNDFTIGFIGGSITEGAGSSKREKRYSSVTVSRLSEMYPSVSFREINAGIGGTGSNLGLFRLEEQILSGNPDMVLVEFSVNDLGDTFSPRYHESILNLLRKRRPGIPVGFIYTLSDKVYSYYGAGELSPLAASLEPVARAWGVPTFPIAFDICRELRGEDSRWAEYFTDTVHPTDLGHGVYGIALADAINNADFKITAPATPVTEIVSDCPRIVWAKDIPLAPGWKRSDKPFGNRFVGYVYSDTPQAQLSFEFDGTAVGIYNTVEADSGILEYSIDGGAWQSHTTWDKYALQYSRDHYRVFADRLAPGHHTLAVRVAEEKPEQSKGRFIRIGGFLVG